MGASTRLAAAVLTAATAAAPALAEPRVQIQRDDQAGRLSLTIDGAQAVVYHYAAAQELPYYVLFSPTGRAMTIVRTEPYPHHRSVWFADRVRLAGQRQADFYNAYYSRTDKKDPNSPLRDRIRGVGIEPSRCEGATAELRLKLLWEMDGKTPVLDEQRRMVLRALGGGQYLLDLTFTVTATYGDVTFTSDDTHYAWPYVRMTSEYSVDKGGTITSSEGGVNQKGTHNRPARWVDCSNTVGGKAEGLAILSHSDNAHPHRWLTRDYGTFGPRRPDEKSGKPFTLAKGQALTCRVGILVHNGDAKAAQVAERYAEYVKPAAEGSRP